MNKVFLGGFGAGFAACSLVSAVAFLVYKKVFEEKIMSKKVEKKVNEVLHEGGFWDDSKCETEGNTDGKSENPENIAGSYEGSYVSFCDNSGSNEEKIESVLKGYESENSSENRVEYRKYFDEKYPDPAELESPKEDLDPEFMDEKRCEEYDRMVENGEIVTEENEDYIRGMEISEEMNSGKKPKLITCESYDHDYPHHDKIRLKYYTGDEYSEGCLVEEEGPNGPEEIFDESKVVGDCLDKFDFRNNDEQVIFVRNFSSGADYEIEKIEGPWVM